MRVTNREKVLMAMYAEHVSENGDFEQVCGMSLNMPSEEFIWAVMCLSREGLIGNVTWKPERASSARGAVLNRTGMYLTREGVQAAEEIMELKNKRHMEKMLGALKWMGEIGATVIAEALSRAMN